MSVLQPTRNNTMFPPDISHIFISNRRQRNSKCVRAVFTWLSKGIGFGFGFTTPFGWLVYLLWFWFYDSQVKTALCKQQIRHWHKSSVGWPMSRAEHFYVIGNFLTLLKTMHLELDLKITYDELLFCWVMYGQYRQPLFSLSPGTVE